MVAVEPRFSGRANRDSHKFLTFLLDTLHEDLSRPCDQQTIVLKGMCCELEQSAEEEVRTTFSHNSTSSHNQCLQLQDYLSWKAFLKNNNSKIVELFQVQLTMVLACGCRRVSSNGFS